MINQRKARLVPVIIDAADIYQVIEPELLLAKRTNPRQPLSICHPHRDLPAKLRRFGNQIPEFCLKLLRKLQSSPAFDASAFGFHDSFGFCHSDFSCPTLSCNFISASSSASGRGGHPATYTSTGKIRSTP